jgi:hypothetical protein
MSSSRGVFQSNDVQQNLKHLAAANPATVPLPRVLEYRVPTKLVDELRDEKGRLKHRIGTASTLAQPAIARLIYMDVGHWGGDATSPESTDAHWSRRRDFGIVCGRLGALCSYEKGSASQIARIGFDPDSGVVDKPTQGLEGTPEFQRILPLLNHLSTNRSLGRVAVTKALLGDTSLAVAPKDDVIHVFLGDLHAPIMTEKDATYSGTPPQWPEFSQDPVVLQHGLPIVTKVASAHDANGRYCPSEITQLLLPVIGKILGLGVNVPAVLPAVLSPATLSLLIPAILGVLGEYWLNTALSTWPDQAKMSGLEAWEWFKMYHGGKKKGADIFENAGKDLKDWLDLLVGYQNGGAKPPVRLAQLGDLFDLWIGLRSAFGSQGIVGPTTPAAKGLANYWVEQSETCTSQHEALALLRDFDTKTGAPGGASVFLYGNHDNYLSGMLGRKAQHSIPGLVAQHGHQWDSTNCDENPKWGYLLTQAAFAVPALRKLEDPLLALSATVSFGIGPRLKFTEMALEESVFQPLLGKKKRPAMFFVMGHTHQPLLQEIVVLESPGANPPTSKQPEYSYKPPKDLDRKVRVGVRFIQVVILDGGYADIPNFYMQASLGEYRKIPLVEPPNPVVGGIIIRDQLARVGPPIPAESSANWSLVINVCEELEITVKTPNGHVVSQRVPALSWGGVQTIEHHHPSQKGWYKVTFDLVWGDFVD